MYCSKLYQWPSKDNIMYFYVVKFHYAYNILLECSQILTLRLHIYTSQDFTSSWLKLYNLQLNNLEVRARPGLDKRK